MLSLFKWLSFKRRFSNSASYWEERYARGRNSGEGSYGKLSEFKARILNKFVSENNVKTVIEYGCGDGNQLQLAHYENYIGFDVSQVAVDKCRQLFNDDPTKEFLNINSYDNQRAELTLSLDVIYHLVEDDVFEAYMDRLFNSSDRFVVIYSNNTNETPPGTKPHVRWRKFTDWIEKYAPNWQLIEIVKNDYPDDSISDFYSYKRIS